MNHVDTKTILAVIAALLGIASAGILLHGLLAPRRTTPPWRRVLLAISPALLAIAAIASLAFHMRLALGGWPDRIGEEGFPLPLVLHVHITISYFIVLLYLTMFAWPLALLTCLAVRHWDALPYLASYFLGYCCVWGFLALLPEAFLYWWWD
jgi:hypothetical protein